MHVYVRVYMHVDMLRSTYLYRHVYTCLYTYLYTFLYADLHMCAYAYLFTPMPHIDTPKQNVNMHVYIHVYIHVCTVFVVTIFIVQVCDDHPRDGRLLWTLG